MKHPSMNAFTIQEHWPPINLVKSSGMCELLHVFRVLESTSKHIATPRLIFSDRTNDRTIDRPIDRTIDVTIDSTIDMTIESSILYTGEVATAVAGTIFEIARQRTLARRRTKLCSIVREIDCIRLRRSQTDQQHSGKLAGQIPRLTRGTLLKPCLSDEQPVGVDDLNVHIRGSRQSSVNVVRAIAGSSETLVLHEIELARARRVATVVVGKRALPVLVVGAITDAGDGVDIVHRQRVVGVVEERIVDGC